MNRDHVRLTASAAQPDQHEAGWEPGYNLVELNVDGPPTERKLHINAHVRVWQTAPGGFRAKTDKQSPVFTHSINLEAWNSPPQSEVVSVRPEHQADTSIAMPIEGGPEMTTLRDLALRFYRLSFSKKSEIAGRLELLEEEDMSLPDYERFRRVFIRAHERGRLEALAKAVRNAEEG